jgi:ferredoxin-nitrite reductase
MNDVERLKAEKNVLDVKNSLARFAREGWESISESDVQRLKWYGLFLRKPTPGFFMLRVRIPNGFSNADQLRVLSLIATEYGNGLLDITTRQQFQIRHLRIENIEMVFEALESVGLTSLQTGIDNVRNIMGCPVAGLHPKEIIDASPWVKALNQHILNNFEFVNLPRKFNIAITGCPDNCIHTETQDLALVPAIKTIGGVERIGFNILAGGKLGSGGYRIASSLNIFVHPEEVVEVCAEIILLFRDNGYRDSRTQNRLAFLLDEWGEERFREELVLRLKRPLETAGQDKRLSEIKDHMGIYRQKKSKMNFVGLKVIVGRILAEELFQVAELAHQYGNGEIRISPNQALIIPNVTDKGLGDFLEEPALKNLLYAPSAVQKNLVSCVGKDYCHLATIETKGQAVDVARRVEEKLDLEKVRPISMHWSGCPAGCGNHLVADIGFLGKKAKVNGEIVDAVDIFVGGRAGPHPKHAVKLLENVPCEKLPQVLVNIIPYHTRTKMYPIKMKRGAKKSVKTVGTVTGRGKTLPPKPILTCI